MSDYDNSNIFARILRGEITPNVIFEDDYVLAFHDIHPQRKVHVLIIPKGAYVDAVDFGQQASDAEIVALIRAVPRVVEILNLEKHGYRLISNSGEHGGQEVPHLHLHLLGGEKIGPMVSQPADLFSETK